MPGVKRSLQALLNSSLVTVPEESLSIMRNIVSRVPLCLYIKSVTDSVVPALSELPVETKFLNFLVLSY